MIGLYLQADDSVLGSVVVDSMEIQQRAIELKHAQEDPNNNSNGDFWVTLAPTTIATQRFQVSGVEFHLVCKFRSSSDIMSSTLDDETTDVFNAGIDGDFLVVPV